MSPVRRVPPDKARPLLFVKSSALNAGGTNRERAQPNRVSSINVTFWLKTRPFDGIGGQQEQGGREVMDIQAFKQPCCGLAGDDRIPR
jgi:hypothetical protein